MYVQCNICMSNVTSSDSPISTACGHVFHISCLQQWVLRSTTCPQCRSHCDQRQIRDLFFRSSVNNLTVFSETIPSETNNEQIALRIIKKDIASKQAFIETLKIKKNQSKDMMILCKRIHQLEEERMREARTLINRLTQHHKLMCDMEKNLKERTDQLDINYIKSVTDSTANEVEATLKEGRTFQSLARTVIMLKRRVTTTEKKKNEVGNHLKVCQDEVVKLTAKKRDYLAKLSTLESGGGDCNEIDLSEGTKRNEMDRGSKVDKRY